MGERAGILPRLVGSPWIQVGIGCAMLLVEMCLPECIAWPNVPYELL